LRTPQYRSRTRWTPEQEWAEFEERRNPVREYAPLVFGGLMLVAAFAFAGHQIGRNASASTASLATFIEEPAQVQTTVLGTKGSLLPGTETFQDLNAKTLRQQAVLAEGKGDLVILDGAADPTELQSVPKPITKKRSLTVAGDAEEKIKIEPAAIDLKAVDKQEEAKKLAKKLALAEKPKAVEKKAKVQLASLDPAVEAEEKAKKKEKKLSLAKRRILMAEENCLARAVYFEARSESDVGQMAVAQVILNRVKSPNYPNTICGVVYQGSHRRNSCQFSFACDGVPDDVTNAASWARSKKIAQRAISGDSDLGKSMKYATNYHADYVKPKWARSMRKLVKIGTHIFYTGG
jgi:spore germination cell wall hydrolase CwlJ-like protein